MKRTVLLLVCILAMAVMCMGCGSSSGGSSSTMIKIIDCQTADEVHGILGAATKSESSKDTYDSVNIDGNDYKATFSYDSDGRITYFKISYLTALSEDANNAIIKAAEDKYGQYDFQGEFGTTDYIWKTDAMKLIITNEMAEGGRAIWISKTVK